MTAITPGSTPSGHRPRLTRRALLIGAGVAGLLAAEATAAQAGPWWEAEVDGVTMENLGPAAIGFASAGSLLIGDTVYIGSRNLAPSRVAAVHLPTRTVTHTYYLPTGNVSGAMVWDGGTGLYVGVDEAPAATNLYRCDTQTGEVEGVAAIPGHAVLELAASPDGLIFATGWPRPTHGSGPAIFTFDPATGTLEHFASPVPDSDKGSGIAVTETAVYFGCESPLTSLTGEGLYRIDRVTKAVEQIHDGVIAASSVQVHGDILTASGGWGLTVISLTDGQVRDFPLSRARTIRDGNLLYANADTTLHRINLTTGTTEVLETSGYASRRIGKTGNLIVGQGGNNNLVWTYDTDTDAVELIDIITAGAPGDGLTGMSVGASDRWVYTAATGVVTLRDLTTGTLENLWAGTEVKDMLWIDGVMYLASYPYGELWVHDPMSGTAPHVVAQFPAGHGRPHVVAWDEINELVVVGAHNNSDGGGSLCLYDPVSGTLTTHINPFGADVLQYPLAAATGDGLIYLGGARANAVGDLAAWDPVSGTRLWRIENPFNEVISSLVLVDGTLHGITGTSSTYFAYDVTGATPMLAWQKNLSVSTGVSTRLRRHGPAIVGVSARSAFVIGTDEEDVPQVLTDTLAGDWFSGPRLAISNDWLYTLSGRDLVRIGLDDSCGRGPGGRPPRGDD